MTDNFAVILKQAILISKNNISVFVKNTDLHKKDKKLAIKVELKAEQYKIVKPQAYDSSLFIGQSCFINNGSQ